MANIVNKEYQQIVVVLLLVLHLSGLAYTIKEIDEDSCQVSCKSAVVKIPVCASDGQSYPSKCEVRRQRICFGLKELRWLYLGECREENLAGVPWAGISTPGSQQSYDPNFGAKFYPGSSSQDRSCLVQRSIALQRSQEIAARLPGAITNSTTIMVPSCEEDGTWSQVQCHPAMDYCWCVTTNDGKAIRQTSVLGRRPNCGDDSDTEGDNSQVCTDAERETLNSDLLRRFSEEFERLAESEKKKYALGGKDFQEAAKDKAAVVNWKFTMLDTNSDDMLSSKEVRGLKRDMKKNLKPKRCSMTFLSRCDMDTDLMITQKEWNQCLEVNSQLSLRLFLSLSADNPQEQMRGSGGSLAMLDQSPPSQSKEGRRTPELMEHQKRLFDLLSAESKQQDDAHRRNADVYNSGSNDRIDRSPLADQQSSLDRDLVSLTKKTCSDERNIGMMKNSAEVFIPNCEPDGRYRSVQCHMFTGYCWCVNMDTGVPIPGTAKLKENPRCDELQVEDNSESSTGERHLTLESFNSLNRNNDKRKSKKKNKKGRKNKRREIPGCPDPHHSNYIQQLTDVLTREMAANGNSLPTELSNNAEMSLEEKAIRFKFMNMDVNNDQKLSKREMRFARHLVKDQSIRAPEKCGKRFRKFCDKDKDKFVSMDEFLICTEVRKKNRRRQRKKGKVSSVDEYLSEVASRNPFTDMLRPS